MQTRPTNQHDRRVMPLVTDTPRGYTVVTPNAVAFIAAGDPVAQSVLERLVRRSTGATEMIDRAERLLGSGAALAYPAVAIVGTEPNGHHVLVHGDPSVHATKVVRDGAAEAAAVRWSSPPGRPLRVFASSAAAITVGVGPEGEDAMSRSMSLEDLRDGTVRANGCIVRWTPHDSPAPTGDTRDNNGARGDELSLAWTAEPPTGPPADPPRKPPIARRSTLRGRTQPAARVDGVLCPLGHFNDPTMHYCNQCGITIPTRSRSHALRPRPTLGMLVFDTGEAFELADDVVVGRRAADDSLVASGMARGLIPAGDVSGISRAHATIRLVGWQVELIDRRSLNGTFLWDAAGRAWVRLVPDIPVTLAHGDAIAFGRRAARLEPFHPDH